MFRPIVAYILVDPAARRPVRMARNGQAAVYTLRDDAEQALERLPSGLLIQPVAIIPVAEEDEGIRFLADPKDGIDAMTPGTTRERIMLPANATTQ